MQLSVITLTGLKQFMYEKLPDLSSETPLGVNLLLKVSLAVRSPRPSWSGFMQMVHKGEHPGEASILFLPTIDLNPDDLTCINSTLNLLC